MTRARCKVRGGAVGAPVDSLSRASLALLAVACCAAAGLAGAQQECVSNETRCVPSGLDEDHYCSGIVYYKIADFWDVDVQDDLAQDAYSLNRTMWARNVSCSDQIPGHAICSECLAQLRAWHCAQQFPYCRSPSDCSRGPCRSLCERVEDKCGYPKRALGCSAYPSSHCGSAAGLSASWLLTTSVIMLLSATLTIL